MSNREILALHGNVGSKEDWEDLNLPNLRAIDLWEYSSLSFFEMAHEVATSLSEGMVKPVLAGYSLGGRIALHAMAIHPDRWGGAIIASANPGLSNAGERAERRSSDEAWATDARNMGWKEFVRKWNGQGVLADSPVNSRQGILESRRSEIALAFETWSLGRQEDLRANLRSFSSPVLWISGEEDSKFREIGEGMKTVFSDFHHAVIPDSGHRVLTSSKTTPKIGEWLGRLNESSRS